MISKNELRFGNWFNDVKGGGYNSPGYQQVRTIGTRGVNEYQDMGASGCARYEDIEPIPLTPELLEQCGFKKEKMGILTNQYRYPIMYGNNSFIINENIVGQWVFRIWNDNKKMDISISIFSFLHQLQNIIFAHTGEELKIELKTSSNSL